MMTSEINPKSVRGWSSSGSSTRESLAKISARRSGIPLALVLSRGRKCEFLIAQFGLSFFNVDVVETSRVLTKDFFLTGKRKTRARFLLEVFRELEIDELLDQPFGTPDGIVA